MAVVVWQFFTGLLSYVQYFSYISAENVGSQPYFSRIFYLSR